MMRVSVITDVRIYKVGKSYYTGAFFRILERYSKCFGKVFLVTRVVESDVIPEGYSNINNFCSKIVDVHSISHVFFSNNKEVDATIKNSDFIILRLPSLIVMFLYKYVRRNKKTYLTEAMGCAWDAFWNHGVLGKIVAPYGFLKMRRIIKNADYATYVTNVFLQKRYPCKTLSIGVSNVDIKKVYTPKHYGTSLKNRFSFLTAASLDVRYKGQQYMIKAISRLKEQGIICDYYLAGDGDKTYLNNIAKKYRVDDRVHFIGPVSHEELLKIMRGIDFYVQPSLQEGLPRSVIEAMSCGCVCFGSNTAGIPELLDDGFVFKRKSVNSLVDVISKSIKTGGLYDASKRNIEESKNYCSDVLNAKRFEYYKQIIKDITESA